MRSFRMYSLNNFRTPNPALLTTATILCLTVWALQWCSSWSPKTGLASVKLPVRWGHNCREHGRKSLERRWRERATAQERRLDPGCDYCKGKASCGHQCHHYALRQNLKLSEALVHLCSSPAKVQKGGNAFSPQQKNSSNNRSLFSSYYCNDLPLLVHLIPLANLYGRSYDYLHFTDEEMEVT